MASGIQVPSGTMIGFEKFYFSICMLLEWRRCILRSCGMAMFSHMHVKTLKARLQRQGIPTAVQRETEMRDSKRTNRIDLRVYTRVTESN